MQRTKQKKRTHKSKIGNFLAGGAFFTFALGSFSLAVQELNAANLLAMTPQQAQQYLQQGLPQAGSPSLYEAIAIKAMEQSPPMLELAEAASIKVLDHEPANIAAWNRLAFIDIADDGQLSKAGVSYLQKSYALAPYGDLSLMTWRTDFASQIWPALPDDLQAKTLQQIPVIGRYGTSWQWRIRHCRENPNEAIALAVCAVAPGVNRPKNL